MDDASLGRQRMHRQAFDNQSDRVLPKPFLEYCSSLVRRGYYVSMDLDEGAGSMNGMPESHALQVCICALVYQVSSPREELLGCGHHLAADQQYSWLHAGSPGGGES